MINPEGRVLAIYISPDKGEPMKELREVQAIAGVGLAGDRYAMRKGAYSNSPKPRIPEEDRQVTLISRAAIELANQDMVAAGVAPLREALFRRNLLLEIDPDLLNSLLGQRFVIVNSECEIEMIGVDPCDPCKRPPQLLARSKHDRQVFEMSLKDRGGLRARVLNSGIVTVGSGLFI